MKKAEIYLEYQNYIDFPPEQLPALYSQAASSDGATINAWRDTWLRQIKSNHERFGPFAERSIGKFWGAHQYQPMIIAGAGPSLKENGHLLKDRGGIPLISCLHNFHYLEDVGAAPEYYVTLDAGPVTIEEVSEGGTRSEAEYWERTKDRKLLAFIGTHPDLLAKWQGEIYFYNCAIPDETIIAEIDKIEYFKTLVSSGGNVLGAAWYIAKAIMGCNPCIFVGVNYAFSYQQKFHAWDSKYDANLGHYIYQTDIYGNRVKTWQSYANFKAWHDNRCESVPGIYINCSEGGTLGAYPMGNIRSIKQMDLADCLKMFNLHHELKEQCINPSAEQPMKLLF